MIWDFDCNLIKKELCERKIKLNFEEWKGKSMERVKVEEWVEKVEKSFELVMMDGKSERKI